MLEWVPYPFSRGSSLSKISTKVIINVVYVKPQGFLGGSVVKNQPAMQETQETRVQFLDWEDPLEKGMATHSSILARRIPWTEEPRERRSIGSRRVGHD